MFKDSKEKFDRYAKKGDTDEIEALTEKLSADLRKSIKALGSFPVLSEQWYVGFRICLVRRDGDQG